MTTTLAKPSVLVESERLGRVKTKLTVFHCANSLAGASLPESDDFEIKSVKMPCSSMTREIFLLKAFEDGADGVVVLVCPEGTCRYLQGNIRAKKRVERVKKILGDIGLGGNRLSIFNIPHGDQSVIDRIIDKTVSEVAELGPNPAARF